MPRPSLITLNAIASSSAAAPRQTGAKFAQLETPYLVLKGIPRTVLPSDLILALDKAGAFKGRAVLRPAQVIRQPSVAYNTGLTLLTSYHLSFSDPSAAQYAKHVISNHTDQFFFSPPAFLRAPNWRQRRNDESPEEVDAFPAPLNPKVEPVMADGTKWYLNFWQTMYSARKQGSQRLEEEKGQRWRRVDTDSFLTQTRMAPLATELRGRQVLLRGLSKTMEEDDVWRMLSGYQVPDLDGLTKLPDREGMIFALYLITLPSISEAHRLVRTLHMTQCDFRGFRGSQMSKTHPARFLIKGEVLW